MLLNLCISLGKTYPYYIYKASFLYEIVGYSDKVSGKHFFQLRKQQTKTKLKPKYFKCHIQVTDMRVYIEERGTVSTTVITQQERM